MEYRVDEGVRYAKTHEWVRVEGGEALIGVSDYAQHKLSDVVFVEPPVAGRALAREKPFTVIESVKAAEDVIAPVTGTVVAANPKLAKHPELVNQDPYGEGWIVRVRLAEAKELDGLMDAAAYRAYVEAL